MQAKKKKPQTWASTHLLSLIGKAKKKTAKKSEGIAKAKPFPSVKPPKPTAATPMPQASPNSAVGR
jgi:hypothetical protein